MGTSISQRSPSTPGWRAVATAYNSDVIPVERVAREIWRAATTQPTGNLALDLGAPLIAQCFSITINAASREDAINTVSREIALSGQASLAADIAQRAVTRSFRDGEDRALSFVQALFGEASNYLVSRDLPGYVGMGDRVRTVSEAMAFKSQVQEQIVDIVRSVPPSAQIVERPLAMWENYVNSVVNQLTGRV
jgi:hypothetical protein